MSSVEIAGELDRSPGVIRVQLHRGMERLRQALPPGFDGLGALLPGRGMAAVRAAVLREASAFSN